MNRYLRSAACCLVVVGFSFLTASDSQAQRRTQRVYEPTRPTLSPYTGLLQSNSGALPNYFALVRPRLEQEAFNSRIQSTTRFQAIQIQNFGRGTTDPAARQTGRGAGFEHYLHYYPPIRLRDQRR